MINIGTAKEALDQFADSDELSFKIDFDTAEEIISNEWMFSSERNDEADEYNYSESEIIPYGEGVEVPKNI